MAAYFLSSKLINRGTAIFVSLCLLNTFGPIARASAFQTPANPTFSPPLERCSYAASGFLPDPIPFLCEALTARGVHSGGGVIALQMPGDEPLFERGFRPLIQVSIFFSAGNAGPPLGPAERRAANRDFEDRQTNYQDLLRNAFLQLVEIVRTSDPAARRLLTEGFLKALAAAEGGAAFVVEAISRYGTDTLGIPGKFERYYRNAAGGPLTAEQRTLIDQDGRWLLECFGLADHPEILSDIPVSMMSLRAFSDFLLSLIETLFEHNITAYREFIGILEMFNDHQMLFTDSLAAHLTLDVLGRQHLANLLSNGMPAAVTTALNTHEYAHKILNFIEPSYINAIVVKGTGPSDWFSTAFEMLSLYRHDGLGSLTAMPAEQLMGMDPAVERSFEGHLRKMDPGTLEDRIRQMDESVVEQMFDTNNIKDRIYSQGAVLGAQALRTAQAIALQEGRPADKEYVAALAGRYLAIGARGGPHQTFEQVIERAEKAFPSAIQDALSSAESHGSGPKAVEGRPNDRPFLRGA